MKKSEITYAEAIAEIEDILTRFENEELDVDMLSAQVKRATELITLCRTRLKKAESEVEKILKDE